MRFAVAKGLWMNESILAPNLCWNGQTSDGRPCTKCAQKTELSALFLWQHRPDYNPIEKREWYGFSVWVYQIVYKLGEPYHDESRWLEADIGCFNFLNSFTDGCPDCAQRRSWSVVASFEYSANVLVAQWGLKGAQKELRESLQGDLKDRTTALPQESLGFFSHTHQPVGPRRDSSLSFWRFCFLTLLQNSFLQDLSPLSSPDQADPYASLRDFPGQTQASIIK